MLETPSCSPRFSGRRIVEKGADRAHRETEVTIRARITAFNGDERDAAMGDAAATALGISR
jgi:hypothetical protein